jgi:hypothetical protein
MPTSYSTCKLLTSTLFTPSPSFRSSLSYCHKLSEQYPVDKDGLGGI